MSRSATSAFYAENDRAFGAREFKMIEADFENDPVRLWTGFGTISWDGKNWLGSGNAMSISGLPSNITGKSEGVQVEVALDPSSPLPDIYQDLQTIRWQGRSFKIWHAFMSDAGAIISDPLLLWNGFMDTAPIKASAQMIFASIGSEQYDIDMTRAKNWRVTQARHQAIAPGDTFTTGLPTIETRTLPWGQ